MCSIRPASSGGTFSSSAPRATSGVDIFGLRPASAAVEPPSLKRNPFALSQRNQSNADIAKPTTLVRHVQGHPLGARRPASVGRRSAELEQVKAAEPDHGQRHAEELREKQRLPKRRALAAAPGAGSPPGAVVLSGAPGVIRRVDHAAGRMLVRQLEMDADEERPNADDGNPEEADEREGVFG